MFFKQSKYTVIDIGTNSIKVAGFIKKKDKMILRDCVLEHLPYETIKDGRIIDTTVVSNKLENVIKRLNYKPKNIITTIPSYNLIIRNMEMPAIPDKELSEAIKWEAEDYLPFSIESAVIEYNILEKNEDNMKLLLIATKSNIIENFLSPFERLGIKPKVVNIQPMALLSLLKYQENNDEAVAIVDIGASGSRVIIGDNKNIYLSRNTDIGGNEFTSIIMEESKKDFLEAEDYKKKNGLESIEEDNEMEFDLALTQIASTGMGESQFLLTIANNLADEIDRSLDFFSMKNRGKSINKIYITGGGSKLEGLHEIIENKINRKLIEIKPYKDIILNNKTYKSQEEFSICAGLALSEVI